MSLSKTVRHALSLFREHGGILRTKQALDLGIHPRTLYQMRDDGVVEPISRGIYRLADLPELAHTDLVTVALRVPRAVVCLLSALSYHDITTEIPHEVHIALPRGTKTPHIDHPPIRVVRLSEPMLSAGVNIETLDGVDVRMTTSAKTVADCFRFRNKLGLDVAIEALTLYLKREGATLAELLSYARVCRVERIMMPYLEALQP